MDYEIVALQEKVLTGVWVRTGNQQPDVMETIGGLWQRLFSGDREKIPNRKGETVYGLYTNYAGDDKSIYDAVTGVETEGVQEVSGDFKSVVVPAGRYAKFTFHGDATKDTGAFWTQVWNTKLPRSYTGDFEEYPPCEDCGNAEINIYVALADVCKNCGMPMTEAEHYGTNADGSKNEEYCCYCYKDGNLAVICQSCGMPMTEAEHFGTNADGGKNEEYCCYCYKDGKFTADCSMEQMIDFCLDVTKDSGMYTDREEAKQQMMEFFPTLKRWKNA